jgi:hypothetical protein
VVSSTRLSGRTAWPRRAAVSRRRASRGSRWPAPRSPHVGLRPGLRQPRVDRDDHGRRTAPPDEQVKARVCAGQDLSPHLNPYGDRFMLPTARCSPGKPVTSRESARDPGLAGAATGRRGRAHRQGLPRARAPDPHRDHDRRTLVLGMLGWLLSPLVALVGLARARWLRAVAQRLDETVSSRGWVTSLVALRVGGLDASIAALAGGRTAPLRELLPATHPSEARPGFGCWATAASRTSTICSSSGLRAPRRSRRRALRPG